MTLNIKQEPEYYDVPLENWTCNSDVTSENITDNIFKIEYEGVEMRSGPVVDGIYTIHDGDRSLMAAVRLESAPIETVNNKIDTQVEDSKEESVELFTNDTSNLKKKPHRLLTQSYVAATVSDQSNMDIHEHNITDVKLKTTPVILLERLFVAVCEHCRGKFYSKQQLQEHIASSHRPSLADKYIPECDTNVKLYKCDNCEKCFSFYDSFTRHKKYHAPDNAHKCDVCEKRFSLSCYLINHMRVHTGEKPYKCDVCEKCFSLHGNLIQHKGTHTGEKSHKCNFCNKYFRQINNLNAHLRLHTGEKPYKCKVCHKCFTVNSHLNKHLRTHTGEKPYQCDICKKSFQQQGYLTTHKRFHTGEKPYQCDFCKRNFILKSYLLNHMRLHTGEKPYECDICKKCFSQSGSLKKHITSHKGEKPFKCDVCKQNFTSKYSLSRHVKTHTGEKPYKCDVCKYSFAAKYRLTKHIRTHAGKSMQTLKKRSFRAGIEPAPPAAASTVVEELSEEYVNTLCTIEPTES